MNYPEVVEKIQNCREEISRIYEEIRDTKTSALDLIATELEGIKHRINLLKRQKKDIQKA